MPDARIPSLADVALDVVPGYTAAPPGGTDNLVLLDVEPGAYVLARDVDEPDGVPRGHRAL